VKLNKAPDVTALQATWVGAHLLALASDKDASVHMTNLETEENSILELPVPAEKAKKGKKEGTKVAAVTFHEPTQTLTGETFLKSSVRFPTVPPQIVWLLPVLRSTVLPGRSGLS
jgi:hypothetical protein